MMRPTSSSNRAGRVMCRDSSVMVRTKEQSRACPDSSFGWARPVVHDEHPGGEPLLLEEVLGVAMSGEGECVDADTPVFRRERDERVVDRLADADRAGRGFDEQLGDSPEVLAGREPLDHEAPEAAAAAADGADEHPGPGT